MAVETLLSFDGNAAYEALGKQLESVVEKLTNSIMEYARHSLPADNGDDVYGVVKESLHAELIQLAQDGIVTGQIGSDAWQSWIAEWGTGSEIDRVNPGLASYMSSNLWNPVRQGYAITGRPEGPYLSLDGTVHDSSGKLAGVDLEALSKTDPEFQAWMLKVGLPANAFQPKPAYHFMRNAVEAFRKDVIDELMTVIRQFNFGNFFV